MYSIWLLPFLAQSTIGETNATLQTIKDMGIALFALVIVALGIIAFIVMNRKNVNTEVVQGLRQVIADYRSVLQDYKDDRDEAIQSKDEQAAANTAALTLIAESFKQSKDILATMDKRQQLKDEADIKRDLLLFSLNTEVQKISADTPWLPHLQDIKGMVGKVIENGKQAVTKADFQIMQDILIDIHRILSIDINELSEKKEAAERIAKQIQDVPVTEDIPAPLDDDEAKP